MISLQYSGERTHKRVMSQPDVRIWLRTTKHMYCEVFLKYFYDELTFRTGAKPIRKKATRKKVAREFYDKGHYRFYVLKYIEELLDLIEDH